MSKPLRILIVEDSEDDAELLVNQLERSGYEPTYQRVDTPDAMISALNSQWDIVVADYCLPRFSALGALTLLKEKGLDLPFVIVSGTISDESAVAVMKAGAHDYLMKDNLARLAPAVERELQEAANRQSRTEIQLALKESEERWHLALRGNNDGIWDWNIKTNRVFFSVRWKKMLGHADSEVPNDFVEWEQRVHPEDLGWVTKAVQDHLDQKTLFYIVEYRLRCKDGTYKWILSRGQALWDETNIPTRMVGSHTDITERKLMEEALRQQAEELAQANRLKDEFLAIVSHELRTPLNPILGWSQLLRNRRLDETATARALEAIERNAKLQQQLIEDLLDVSYIVQGNLQLRVTPIQLVPIIESAIETVRLSAEAKSIQLQSLLDPNAGCVAGDQTRIHQVMWNLLTNAIKFTPSGGRVEVRLSMFSGRCLSPDETDDRKTAKKYSQIQVSDNGVGIKAEFLPYVFDRFRQANSATTRSYGGLGLGLAIVRHLVELHGGRVYAASPGEGQGTTVTVQLPLLEESGEWSYCCKPDSLSHAH